jgi:prevent-host-death family protein
MPLLDPTRAASLMEHTGGRTEDVSQGGTEGHMRRMAASEARRDFAEVVNRVAYGKERVIIGRRGKELAAVIPMADLRLLERLAEKLEDRLDAEDALRVEADARDESVPWEQVKEELGLAVPRGGKAKRSTGPRTATGARSRGRRSRTRRAR